MTDKDMTHTPSGSSENPRKENEPKKPEVEQAKKDQQPEQKERLWKHESEIPDASSDAKGKMGSGQRQDED
jgi:hypothetical protein